MIDLINNVPDIYVDESRDFQLYLRLLNIIIGGTKFDIDHIVDIFDPKICNNRVLDLLCTTFNFRPKIRFTDQDLRLILSGFGGLIRNKGTRKGIEQAISLVMKTQNITTKYYIDIVNKDPERSSNINYYIELQIDQIVNRSYLSELLEYVKPVGYTVDIFSVDKTEHVSRFGTFDKIEFLDSDEEGNGMAHNAKAYSNITNPEEDYDPAKYSREEEYISKASYKLWNSGVSNGTDIIPRYFETIDGVSDNADYYQSVNNSRTRYKCIAGPHYIPNYTTYRIESAEWDTSIPYPAETDTYVGTSYKLINTYISIPENKTIKEKYTDTINTSEIIKTISDGVDIASK